ncbi:hypothetical protein B566_EDAN011155 [Ephemera danica]|nr:hypothetical protein B566_EDAN011155 [Ephemera danica]
MLNLLRPIFRCAFQKQNINSLALKSLSTTASLRLKEIRVEEREGKNLVIEGVYIEHPRAQYMLKNHETQTDKCSICATGLEIKHTDVLILSQFLRPDGCMLPRRITGLCRRQQKSIGTMVSMAQKAGLMPNLAPAWSKKDPQKRSNWKKFNTYFDESTIFRPKPKPKYPK